MSGLHLQLARCFNTCFAASEGCVMVGGAPEPFYQPAKRPHRAVLRYREDFAASVLHEAAHWCIAGAARRQLFDFGYWYVPPPRTAAQQQRFIAVEGRAQAVERYFARACGLPFQVSVDDVSADAASVQVALTQAIEAADRCYRTSGWPARAAQFAQALKAHPWNA